MEEIVPDIVQIACQCLAYLLKSKQVYQAEVSKMWNEIKNKDIFEISDKHLKAQLKTTAI